MRPISRHTVLILLLLLLTMRGYGQYKNSVEMPVVFSIPALSLIDFSGPGARITFTSGREAEQIVTSSTSDKTWINYSSVIEEGSSNSISAHISSGNLPAEIKIKLDVGNDAGQGGGALGTPTGEIVLATYPQNIITGIGSCYTGRGTNKGRQLTYSWEGADPLISDLEISVTYTITTSE